MSVMKVGEVDGTPCNLFIDGYCTDLKPKEPGCCGKEYCRRFEYVECDQFEAEYDMTNKGDK